MCAIIGIFHSLEMIKKTVHGLTIMKNRGRDSYGLIINNSQLIIEKNLTSLNKKIKSLKTSSDINSVIGHALHSIVNYIPQPLHDKKTSTSFIANCEIYNWKELNAKYNLNAKNDSELIFKLINLKGVSMLKSVLNELDGVYAFAYQTSDTVYIARDILGIKPVWYSYSNGIFAFSSEKKVLLSFDEFSSSDIIELNPRTILKYNIKTKKLTQLKRKFFSITPLHNKSYEQLKRETLGFLTNAIAKRIPDQKFGVLFSGGIDSVFIAYICKQLGVDFTCYTVAISHAGMKIAEDLVYAKKVAKSLGFKLKVRTVTLSQIEKYLNIIVPLIEDNNVVKVGVALTFYLACEQAKKDNVRVIFSGLGSEEIFAGYERHKNSLDINKECLSGLIKMYERDLYRDDVITMNNNLELRLPFLDKELVGYALKIPPQYKIKGDVTKLILRDIAFHLRIPEEFAFRKKRAAQYGSKTDKAIAKLAKQHGFKYKSDYLKTYYNPGNVKLGILFSSGKDSIYAMYIMHKQNYDIKCLITIKSKNPDSYMFHTPNIDLTELQAQALQLPLITETTEGRKEHELNALKTALQKAKEKYNIEGIVTGAIFSNYQRERIERIADQLGLKIFSPLWHMDQEYEMRSLLKNNFKFILSSVAAYGLDEKWLGKVITETDINKLVELNKKVGINIAGEGGEFESLVLDMPMFKQRIVIDNYEIIKQGEETAKLIVKKARLVKK